MEFAADRRSFLGVIGATLVPGCSALPRSSGRPDSSPSGADGTWPQYARDTAHTAYNSGVRNVENDVRWQFGPHGYVSTPLVVGDSVWVVARVPHERLFGEDTSKTALYALDRTDGTAEPKASSAVEFWESASGWGAAQPILHRGSMYVGGGTSLAAVNVRTGATRWTYDTSRTVDVAPVAADGRVFFTDGVAVYAIDAEDGSKLWKRDFQKGQFTLSSPALHEDVLYVSQMTGSTSESGKFTAVDASTGEEIWLHTGGTDYSMPAVTDGTAYVGDETTVYAFDAETGDVEWQTPVPGTNLGVGPERVYVTATRDRGSALVALSRSDGEQVWSVRTAGNVFHYPAITGDTVFLSARGEFLDPGYARATVRAVKANTGKHRWTRKLDGIHAYGPVVAGDSVYVTCRRDDDRHVLTAIGATGQ